MPQTTDVWLAGGAPPAWAALGWLLDLALQGTLLLLLAGGAALLLRGASAALRHMVWLLALGGLLALPLLSAAVPRRLAVARSLGREIGTRPRRAHTPRRRKTRLSVSRLSRARAHARQRLAQRRSAPAG